MDDYSSYETIVPHKDGGVLAVKLDRPQALNAVSAWMHTGLSRVFEEIAVDDTVDAVVLTGEGRAFFVRQRTGMVSRHHGSTAGREVLSGSRPLWGINHVALFCST